MTGPFVYVGTWTIKEGKVDEAREWLAKHTDFLEDNEPRLISINFFVDEAARRVVNVQVHPDADSMAFHMKLIAEHLPAAFDIIEAIELEQYYGAKSPELAELLAPYDEGNVPTTNVAEHLAGFTRTTVR